MSAEIPAQQPLQQEREKLHEALSIDELRELGHLAAMAIERDDLDTVVAEHEVTTGVQNPNTHGEGLFVGQGDVPMTADSVYRAVDVRGVHDLAETGVVRGAYTATRGDRASTNGHATYWNNGKEGVSMKLSTPGHFIIQAPKAAAEAGWVKANDVEAIYARDQNGELHDITKL